MKNRFQKKQTILYYVDKIIAPLATLKNNLGILLRCHHWPRKMSEEGLEEAKKFLDEKKTKK